MQDDFPIESRFALGSTIGRGASGDVVRAEDRETGGWVAVKRLKPIDDDPGAIERFHREARLLAQIDDPRVVRYVAHGVDARGRPCIAVEWLEGEDLAHRQKRARLDAAGALDVARQAALGLAALHRAGIVHRDVKPANIFLLPDEEGRPRVKLIDLGIARAAGDATLTRVGLAIGTPFYMSPEQARGEARVTHLADQFSLGSVLFELVTGRRPFLAENLFAVLAKIVLSEPPRLRALVPAAPAELEALLVRALSKEPSDRFASARDLADAIAAVPRWDGDGVAPEGGDAPTARVTLAMSSAIEQRVVTALFAGAPDLQGFAAIAEQHGASSHPTLGGRVIAVFGGDRTMGDEAVRAARAALVASARIAGARLSLATGRALSTAGGLSGDLLDRGAVNVDASPAAAEAPIRVDEATALLLAEHFVIEGPLGERALVGLRPAAAPPRTLAGRPTPCVGRDRELANLDAIFTECVSEPVAHAVLVTGPAGIGKSRIRYELAARLAGRDPRPEILLGRGSPLSEASAFGLIAPAIRRFAGILDGEPATDQQRKLAARAGDKVSAGALELLGELAGIPGSAPAGRPRRDAMLTGDLMRAAWLEWLEAECAERPVIVILEDVQWGDVASIRFVDAALRALEARPFFVLAVARPEVHDRFPALWSERGAQEIRLGPLLPRASERLVRAALGDAVDPATVQRIVARAEGNAFYMEELIRAAAEGAGEALPDTVLGMVQARLDALGSEPKRILRAASIFGESFWRGGVAALLGEEAPAIGEPLERLAIAEVIARRKDAIFPDEDEYAFRHAIVREAAYAMVPDVDRRVGHRLAGAWLARAGASDPVVLAAHFERGDDPLRAAACHLRAAEIALAGNDFQGAVEHAERSVACGAKDEKRGAARLIQAEANRWRGDLAAAAIAGAEAAELLPRGGPAWFHAVREIVAANGRQGHFDLVGVWAREASACEACPEAAGARIACLVPAAVQLTYAGEAAEAARLVEQIDRIAAAAAADLDPTVTARLHQLRAIRADRGGDLEAALAHNASALAAFERAGDRRSACLTLSNLGFTRAALGCFPEAEEAFRLALSGAERMGLATVAALARHNLGGVLAALGRLDEARDVEARAVEAFHVARDPRLEGASRVYLARILLAMGDAKGAEVEVRRVADAPASPPPLRAGALAVLAEALRAQGSVADALVAAAEGAAFLDVLGSVEDFETIIGVAHAEALSAAGRGDEARAAIASAWRRVLVRAGRLGEAARARFLEEVPDNARCAALAALAALARVWESNAG